jgi:hypothetical protein
MTIKKCSSCLEDKLLEEYNKGNAKFGRKSECKLCQRARGKKYKQRPEVRRRETENQKVRRRKESPLKKTIRYLANKDRVEAWMKENPQRVKQSRKAREHRRRQRENSESLLLSSIVFLEYYNLKLFKRDLFTCEYCSAIIEGPYHLEHIVPLCKGGGNDIFNLAISCPKCNNGLGGKGVKLLEEWNPHYSYKIQQRNNKWKTEELPRWLKTQEKES